jgi:hypothetical protein
MQPYLIPRMQTVDSLDWVIIIDILGYIGSKSRFYFQPAYIVALSHMRCENM